MNFSQLYLTLQLGFCSCRSQDEEQGKKGSFQSFTDAKRQDTTMLNDDEFHMILNRFDRSWAGYRKVRKRVKKRLSRHMRALGVDSVTEYLRVLEHNQNEADICRECLLVTISRFFRDRRLWQYLKDDLLPEMLKNFTDGIRVWSVGCAGGEEVYSLVILWKLLDARSRLEVVATDMQPENLARARAGIYEKSSLREVSEEIRNSCFIACTTGSRFAILPRFKRAVRWQCHDLFSLPPEGGPFHLLFLRNSLLTYHQGKAMHNAFSSIVETIAPHGCLIVGSHERPPETEALLLRNPECPWIYHVHG